jgi:hypothetical protein
LAWRTNSGLKGGALAGLKVAGAWMSKLRPRGDVSRTVEGMRGRFVGKDELGWFLVRCGGDFRNRRYFFEEFPTREERVLFSSAFPSSFYDLWGFFADSCDGYPSSAMYEFREIFRHPKDEFLEMLRRNPPTLPFDPPNVSDLIYSDHHVGMTVARGRWWKANGYPMTEKEREWLILNAHMTSSKQH